MKKQFYTIKQAAEYLGITQHRLARLRREGKIKTAVGDDAEPGTRSATYHIDELNRAKSDPTTKDQRFKANKVQKTTDVDKGDSPMIYGDARELECLVGAA